MSRWWRAYDEAVEDPKLQRLPDALFKAWFNIMCVASKNDGAIPPAADLAFSLRITPVKAAEILTKLTTAGLLDNVDGVFTPHNWDGRQYKSDSTDPTAPKRMKRYRERKRNERNATVTDTVTDKRPEAEQSKTDQSTPDARELDENGLKQETALRAAFTAACNGRSVMPDMKIIKTWLLDGISVSTISTTVPTLLKRKTDMASLAYCDKAVREAHAKQPDPALLEKYLNQEFIIEGTMEWSCWEHHLRLTTGRGSPVCDQKDERGSPTGKRGWPRPSKVPPGYDEATGEKLAPNSEENAA